MRRFYFHNLIAALTFAAHAATQTFTITDDDGTSRTVTFRTNGHAIERLDSQRGFVPVPLRETLSPRQDFARARVAFIEHTKAVMLPGFVSAGGSLSNIVNELSAAIHAADTTTNCPINLIYKTSQSPVRKDVYLHPFSVSNISAYAAVLRIAALDAYESLAPTSSLNTVSVWLDMDTWNNIVIKPFGNEDRACMTIVPAWRLPPAFFTRFPTKSCFRQFAETQIGSVEAFNFQIDADAGSLSYIHNTQNRGFIDWDDYFYLEARVLGPLSDSYRKQWPVTLFAAPHGNATSLWARACAPGYNASDLYHYAGDTFTRIAFDTQTGFITASNAVPFAVSTGGSTPAKLWFCLNQYSGELYCIDGAIFEEIRLPNPPPPTEPPKSLATESLRRITLPKFKSNKNECFTNVFARFLATLREAAPDCPVTIRFDPARADHNIPTFDARHIDAYAALFLLADLSGLVICCNGQNIELLDNDTYTRRRTSPVQYIFPEQARPVVTFEALKKHFPLPKNPPSSEHHRSEEPILGFEKIGVEAYDPQSGIATFFAVDESSLPTTEDIFRLFDFPRYTASVRTGPSGIEIIITDTATGATFSHRISPATVPETATLTPR